MSKFEKLWILWHFENDRFRARNVSPFSSSSHSSSCYSVPPIFFALLMVRGFPNLAHSFLDTFPRGGFWKIPKFLIPSMGFDRLFEIRDLVVFRLYGRYKRFQIDFQPTFNYRSAFIFGTGLLCDDDYWFQLQRFGISIFLIDYRCLKSRT